MLTQHEIQVAALMDGNRIVMPQFWLCSDSEYRKDRKDNSLSAAEYNDQMRLPTLAELRHAYFDAQDGTVITCEQNERGVYVPMRTDFVSPEYRKNVQSKRGYGEWTSTFLEDGKRAIERPENVVYKNGVWRAEGGKVTLVEIPPDGWTLEYDKPTGFPSRSSQNRKDAEKVFGDDTSYCYFNSNGLRAALRGFGLDDSGPFYVGAVCVPGGRRSAVGGRACSRSEQGAERFAR